MRLRELWLVLILVVVVAFPALAEQDGEGWTLSARFQGSSNSDGLVLKADPTLGYSFNRHFQTYFGLPAYFVNESSTIQTQTASTNGFISGLGNAYVGFRLAVNHDVVNYSSTLEGTAPTGDKAAGFSTGRPTVDWTNRFSHTFSSVTPFASAGLANTVSDTSFFVRPFTSLGIVSHFDGGAKFRVSQVDVGASAYAVRASGQQKIISKIFKNTSNTSSSGSTSTGSGKNRPFETGRGLAQRISLMITVFRHGLQRMQVPKWTFRLVTREARGTTSIRFFLESVSAWVSSSKGE
jgi:hypothetical protein